MRTPEEMKQAAAESKAAKARAKRDAEARRVTEGLNKLETTMLARVERGDAEMTWLVEDSDLSKYESRLQECGWHVRVEPILNDSLFRLIIDLGVCYEK